MRIGDQIGQYTVVEHIGRGGMADVWSARDERLRRTVAIKTIMADLSNEPMRARFEHEARTIAALEHSNILPIYDFGEFQRQLYIVMRYVAGGSLLDRILLRGGLARDEIVRVGEAVARALERAHAERIVHRDLKPANILLDRFGTPYLADFGLAEVIGGGDQDGSAAGTLVYMPPEQMYGQPVDHRADIYAFAITLFQMITGEFPFEGQGVLCVRQVQFGDALPDPARYRPGLPARVGEMLRAATAPAVEARPASATRLMAEVSAALAEMAADAEPSPAPEPAALPLAFGTTVPEEDNLAATAREDAGREDAATVALKSADLRPPSPGAPLLPQTASDLFATPPIPAGMTPGLLEAKQAFQNMVRVWARGQGRFLTGATPFAAIHAFYSEPETHGLVIAEAGREAMLRGAVEHDYALEHWLALVPDPAVRRTVFLHALRSDTAAARARAARLLRALPEGEREGVTLAAAHLLHAETDPDVRLAVVELLAVRQAAGTAWAEEVFSRDIDLLLAEQALREDSPGAADLAARTIGRLRMGAAARHIAGHAADAPARTRRALAGVRDEADCLPGGIPAALRRAAFLRLTGQKLAADLPRLGLRYFLALLGTGIGLGVYVAVMFPTASLLQLAHLYRVVGNAQTFGLVAGLGGTLAAALPLRLAGNEARGAALWPRPARFLLGAGLGTLVGAIAYLNFQVLALQYSDPKLEIVLLGGLGLALGAALAATLRWPLGARLGASALSLFGALFLAWRLNQAGVTDAIIFLRNDGQIWIFALMGALVALGIFGPEVLDALRRPARRQITLPPAESR